MLIISKDNQGIQKTGKQHDKWLTKQGRFQKLFKMFSA